MQATTTSPSPQSIFDTFNAYQRSAALKGAIELDFFTAIGEGADTAEAIAKRCDASERGTRILADFLTVMGLLTKSAGKYALSQEAAFFLDRKSPAYLGSASRFLLSPELIKGFDDVAAVVRKGGTLISDEGTVSHDNPVWVEFARGMAPMMFPMAQALAEICGGTTRLKVLDIAAGHGIFGIILAQRNPNAQIVALDWPNVLAVAQENAERFGVANRWSKLPGDAMQVDYGTGYDLVLLTNFLHHFDRTTCESLLRKIRASLKPGGRVATLEFVPNEDRVSPPVAAMFSMIMLASTARGDAYTFADLEKMFSNAGYSKSELHVLANLPQSVIVSFV